MIDDVCYCRECRHKETFAFWLAVASACSWIFVFAMVAFSVFVTIQARNFTCDCNRCEDALYVFDKSLVDFVKCKPIPQLPEFEVNNSSFVPK